MAEVHAGPRQTSRLYDITGVTEGEMDLLIALLGSVRGDLEHSPRKYAVRLLPRFQRAAGYKAEDTDACNMAIFGYRDIWFSSYDTSWPEGLPDETVSFLLPASTPEEPERQRRRQGFWPWKR